jgi:hypothetical protein
MKHGIQQILNVKQILWEKVGDRKKYFRSFCLLLFSEEKQPKKRSSTSYISDDNDEYQVPCRSPAKKQKRSPTLIKGLPVSFYSSL